MDKKDSTPESLNTLYNYYYTLAPYKRRLFKTRVIYECGWSIYQWENRIYNKHSMTKAESSLVERVFNEIMEIGE